MQIPRPGDTKFEVLKAVNDYCEDHPKGPTVDELREQLDLKTRSAIQFHIDDLVEMGFLTRLPRKTRSLRPTSRGKKLVSMLLDLDGALDGATQS